MAWNGSDQTGRAASTTPPDSCARRAPASGAPNQTILRVLLALLLIAALAGAAVWYFCLRPVDAVSHRVRKESKPSAITEVKPAPARTNAAPARAKRRTLGDKAIETDVAGDAHASNAIPPNAYVCSSGTNRVFRNGVEQVLTMIFSTDVGEMPPPLPRIHATDEQNMAAILVQACEALETDSVRAKDKKETVNFAKKELVNYIRDGGNYEDFFRYYRGELLKAYNFRRDAQRAVTEFEESDAGSSDPQMVRDYYKKVNEKLTEKGIKNLEIPEDYAEAPSTN